MDESALDAARALVTDLDAKLAKARKRYRLLADIVASLPEPPSPDELAAELGVSLEFAVALLAGDDMADALAAVPAARRVVS